MKLRFALTTAWLALGCGESDPRVADVDVAAGTAHACALDAAGAVRCWGENRFGAIGDGTTLDRHATVRVHGLPSDVTAIDAQGDTTCALTRRGELWCWGQNHHGQLGDGSIEPQQAPVRVPDLPEVREVSVGWAHVCAIDQRARPWCWGWNGPGQLGDGSTVDRLKPAGAAVELGADTVAIEAGYGVSCARDADAELRCSGEGSAAPAGPISDAVDVASGADHTLVALRDGSIVAYGRAPGGLALEPPADGWTLPEPVRVVANLDHACALAADGALSCWGKNDDGQLGDGTVGLGREPTPAQPDLRFTDVAVGGAYTCAVTGDGRAVCWGANDVGQLGDGTAFDSRVPVEPR